MVAGWKESMHLELMGIEDSEGVQQTPGQHAAVMNIRAAA